MLQRAPEFQTFRPIENSLWLKAGLLALVVAALGLPVNDLPRYGILLFAAVLIFSGTLTVRPLLWLIAVCAVAAVVLTHRFLPPPQIEEGHNVFIVEASGGALERGLPPAAFRTMLAEFDATYPPDKRCAPRSFGCWRDGSNAPLQTFAFSTDSIYGGAQMSRRVDGIDFSDAIWHRLGFINDNRYNWTANADILRNKRKQHWWDFLHPWQMTMPYFVAYRFPAAFAGSALCWSGEVLWEGDGGRFTTWRHFEPACRTIDEQDIGRLILGVSIASPLAMELRPPPLLELQRMIPPVLGALAAAVLLALLVRVRRRQFILPLTFVGLALAVAFFNDASFIGGVRPLDGGDDGLFYEGTARRIVQAILNGDFAEALKGGEAVYYYGGPGLRYLRALEHFIFGDSFLGYLSLMLGLPLLVLALFRRFLGARAALALAFIFVVIPVGAVFGTSFFHYVKWAARGFADPAAAAFFVAGLIVLIGPPPSPDRRFSPAFCAGLLFAAALWVRPNLAPGAAVLLGGAGLAALYQAQIVRLAGLCLGFAPVFGMALHNWVFGRAFVLFSSNATIEAALPMPPSAYPAALGELIRLDLAGPNLSRWVLQWARWLSGPSESFAMIPLHIAAVAITVRVVFLRASDPWLRLTALATLALHPVAWFYLSYDRYYYLMWLLTLLVCAVWVRDEGFALLEARCPNAIQWWRRHPLTLALDRILQRYAVSAS